MNASIEEGYQIMNRAFFGVVFLLEVYVICIKLKFRLDLAGYTILLIQLAVVGIRIFFN
jgi:hypothetical protein